MARTLDLMKKVFNTDHAYVAGGALRDLDNNKAINDIDIFVSADDSIQQQSRMARQPNQREFSYAGVLDRLYKTKSKTLIQAYGEQWPSGLQLIDVTELELKPHPIQVVVYKHIGRRGPRTLLDYFDIGLCKISYDGERVYRTEAYKKDREEKKLSLDYFFRKNSRSLKRMEKLKAKYPDFEPIIPEDGNDRVRIYDRNRVTTGVWNDLW